MIEIKKLHHAAYRCKDSESTRVFYEEFLGLKLVKSLIIEETKTKRKSKVLHTFYQLNDGSHIAFFEEPLCLFDFKRQHDFDLHIAFEVEFKILEKMFNKGKGLGLDTRGIIDHGFIKSVYFRDPNGYVIELSANIKTELEAEELTARDILNKWQNKKPQAVY